MKPALALMLSLAALPAGACDLCAVYRAGDTRAGNRPGWVFSLAEQFIPYRTAQIEGEEVKPDFAEHVDSSITHLVAGYNVTARFGVSLNLPLTHLQFQRMDVRYSRTGPLAFYTESGVESGLGDLALIGRGTLLNARGEDRGFAMDLLAGVKFPTGDPRRIRDEVDQTEIYNSRLPPGTPHDPLGHSITSVHQHTLALGSGSFDGIFGLTANGNWRRWFFKAQFQYYLRTEGEPGFTFGDEWMISGGPGAFLFQKRTRALSLQVNAVYDDMAQDEVLGQRSNRTGLTAWYLGPLLNFTWRSLNANAGVDVPLQIRNNGYQVVPDYRLHGGVSWSF